MSLWMSWKSCLKSRSNAFLNISKSCQRSSLSSTQQVRKFLRNVLRHSCLKNKPTKVETLALNTLFAKSFDEKEIVLYFLQLRRKSQGNRESERWEIISWSVPVTISHEPRNTGELGIHVRSNQLVNNLLCVQRQITRVDHSCQRRLAHWPTTNWDKATSNIQTARV